MKKIALTLLFALLLSVSAYAQEQQSKLVIHMGQMTLQIISLQDQNEALKSKLLTAYDFIINEYSNGRLSDKDLSELKKDRDFSRFLKLKGKKPEPSEE